MNVKDRSQRAAVGEYKVTGTKRPDGAKGREYLTPLPPLQVWRGGAQTVKACRNPLSRLGEGRPKGGVRALDPIAHHLGTSAYTIEFLTAHGFL
jgi:hypothetical protein